jgi:hypothetical protein
MKEHRIAHSTGGNCFDVAIWLQQEFACAGIESRIIGRSLCTPKAHIAVIAYDVRGQEYFCDLGDQWLEPILINEKDPDFSPEYHSGFASGLRVRVKTTENQLLLTYLREDGKESIELFPLTSVPADILMKASDHSQALLRRPFVEIRAIHPKSNKIQLWEYDRKECFWHLDSGTAIEEGCDNQDCWTERIHHMTGMSLAIISAAFGVYSLYGTEM